MSFTENKIDFSIHRNEKDPGLRQPIWNSEQDLKVWTALFTSKQRKLLRNCVLYCGFIKKMMSISGHSQNSNWTLFFSDFCVYEKDTAPSFIKIKREVFETARFFLCRARNIFQKKKEERWKSVKQYHDAAGSVFKSLQLKFICVFIRKIAKKN